MKLYLPLLYVMLVFAQTSIGQEWKNIIPLKSTKTDIEKIFGQPVKKDEKRFFYATSDGNLSVSYAADRCQGEIPGWNVDTNTVLSFSIILKNTQKLNDSEINEIIEANPIHLAPPGDVLSVDDIFTFISLEKGTVYYLGKNGILASINFSPKVSDNHLRCKGFPLYNAASASYYPSSIFELVSDKLSARLLEYVGSPSRSMPDDLKQYLIIRQGNDVSNKQFKSYILKIKSFISSKKKANSKNIIMILGGRITNESRVEVFDLDKKYPPPILGITPILGLQ